MGNRTDMALVQDKKFKPWVQKYADSEELFFKEYVLYHLTSASLFTNATSSFSAAVCRLFELGVPTSQFGETILFKTT
jgi:cytochrome c peroxidase